MDPQVLNDRAINGNETGKVSLSTSFMGLDLESPLIAGSCPRNIDFESTRIMVAAGIGARWCSMVAIDHAAVGVRSHRRPMDCRHRRKDSNPHTSIDVARNVTVVH